jgi:hypothetical protein
MYGYRRVAALLRVVGWQVSDGRFERLALIRPPTLDRRRREFSASIRVTGW